VNPHIVRPSRSTHRRNAALLAVTVVAAFALGAPPVRADPPVPILATPAPVSTLLQKIAPEPSMSGAIPVRTARLTIAPVALTTTPLKIAPVAVTTAPLAIAPITFRTDPLAVGPAKVRKGRS
jgi:hypothetical protein